MPPGSEYDRLRPLSYPRTDVFALCFSVIKPEQLQRIREYWFPNLQHHAPWAGIILIGTHQDIRDAVETASPSDGEKVTPISFSEAQALANELGAMSYIETSTSDKESVRKLYDMLLSASLKHSSPTQIQDKSKKKRQARCAIM
jgi:GTPase SAR1 family protein